MKFTKFILLIAIISSVFTKIPKIQIYVESLCFDCLNFLTTSYKEFLYRPDHASLAECHIIPFGNGQEIKDSTGHYNYKCQHGPNECYGHVWEICGLKILTDLTGTNELGHKFTVCLEENIQSTQQNFDKAAEKCLSDRSDYLAAVTNCVRDPTVSEPLLHEEAQETLNLVPPHTYVPWIVVDGVHDVEIENQILDSLTRYLTKEKDFLPNIQSQEVTETDRCFK